MRHVATLDIAIGWECFVAALLAMTRSGQRVIPLIFFLVPLQRDGA
jgi:hypothetical protein